MYTPLEPIPCYDKNGNQLQLGRCQTGNNFPLLVAAFFRLLITLGSIFAIVMLTVAGIGYMLSEAAVDIDKAKKRARAALWGLVLLIGCWLILYTINPKLLQFDIFEQSLQKFKPSAQTTGGISKTGPSGGVMASFTAKAKGDPDQAQKLQDFMLRCVNQLGGKVEPVKAGSDIEFNCVRI